MKKSLGAAVLAAAALIPGTAQAAFISLSPPSPYDEGNRSIVFYSADAGETNNVVVSNGAGSSLVITDTGAVIETFDSDCAITNEGHTATCTPAEATAPRLSAFLADGNDVLNNAAAIPAVTFGPTDDFPSPSVFVNGAEGDDVLNGNDTFESFNGDVGNDTVSAGGGDDVIDEIDNRLTPPQFQDADGGNDALSGGAGDDSINAGDGADTVAGEAGTDHLDGGTGDNVIDGGADIDTVNYDPQRSFDANGSVMPIAASDAGATVVLSSAARAITTGNGFPGQNDSLNDIEDVDGSAAADSITGSAVGNILTGFGGNDTIVGGAGPDNLQGGSGIDAIRAQDTEVDRVSCGNNPADTASVDNIDQVIGCPLAGTTVTQVPAPAGPVVIRESDTVKARLSKLKAAKRVKAKRLRRNGRYSATFTPSEAVGATVAVEARVRRFKAAGYVTLAERSRTLEAGRAAKFTLRIPKKLRRSLRKGRRIRLSIRLVDGGGNVTNRRVTIRLT